MLMTSSARPRVALLGVPGTARTSAGGAPSGATAQGWDGGAVPGWRASAFVLAGRTRAQWGSSWRRMLLVSWVSPVREGAGERYPSGFV